MSFELDSRGADDFDARARTDGIPFGTPSTDSPGFFAGSASAPVRGLARGLVAKPALLLGDAVTPMLQPVARAIDKAVGGTHASDFLRDEQRKNRQAMDDLRLDPLTTGFAGQVLGGLFDLGGSAIAFSPEGAAVMEGYARREELRGQGIDEGTATAVGAVTGAATLVGVKAPVTLGKAAAGAGVPTLARNMAYGASINLTTGVAERGTSREILERAGYKEQAVLLDPFDRQAMLAEGILGSLFSGSAAALELRNTVRGQRAADAALALRAAKHGAVDSAPGVPADAKTMAAHRSAFDTAADQLLRGEPVNVGSQIDDTTFVRPVSGLPGSAAEELRSHVADLLPIRASFMPAPDAPRGVRNHNPGNIEAGPTPWLGQTGSDGRFATFDSPEAGIRALARTLLAYQDKHGLNTVEGIIGRWAPPSENKTKAYVQEVASAIGFEPTTPLDLKDTKVLQSLTSAIIAHENGAQPYPPDILRAGVDAALGGRRAEVVTERGTRVPLRYQLRELTDLTTSHDAAMQPNAAYPAELQPRDRSSAASQVQAARISQNLEPELLAESARASEGAPIVGQDDVVESGNGRTLALAQAYDGERGASYRQWLETNASRFGFDPQDVRSMQRPVLVRERLGDMDRAEFARQAKESPLAVMSPTEQAKADAARIADLSGLVANEDGSINLAKSTGLVRQFLQAAVGPNEMGSVVQADGHLSKAGLQRLRQAVFAKAYQDPGLVAALSESTDANVRSVLAGMMRAAPEVAKLRELIAAGGRHPIDPAGPVAHAARLFSDLRRQGQTVDQHLTQGDLLDAGVTPEVRNLLVGLQETSREPTIVAAMLQRLTHDIDSLGDPRQQGMFDGDPTRVQDLTAGAAEYARGLPDESSAASRPASEVAGADPTMRAAAEVVAATPELRVVLEDGTELSAREVLARSQVARELAQRESAAFEAAVNCFLRT